MRPEAELCRAFLASLAEPERQLALRYWWWAARPWPWDNIHPLAWGAVDTDHEHLQRAYADWLLHQGDPRGQVVHLLQQLACARASRSVAIPLKPCGPAEAGFRAEILRHQGDPTPWLVLADWLEEQENPKATEVRLLGRLRPLENLLPPDWLETLGLPEPPGLPAGWAGQVAPAVRTALLQANQEAVGGNHEYLGTHHLLLGLVPELPLVFSSPGPNLEALRLAVRRLAPPSPDLVTLSRLPRSSCLRQALTRAFEEVGSSPLLPHHLLLGLCRARPCVAVRVLEEVGLTPHTVCTQVLDVLNIESEPWLRTRPEVW
jgi:uncharacterized protein (TIGR02996 family)